MKEKFDDIIKKTLEDNQSVPESASWDNFKDKLKAAQQEISDDALDDLIKDKIAAFETPFHTPHWKVLRHKLKLQTRNLENLYVSKAFEVITFFLLLITFMQHGLYQEIQTKKQQDNYAITNQPLAEVESSEINLDKDKLIDFASAPVQREAPQTIVSQTEQVKYSENKILETFNNEDLNLLLNTDVISSNQLKAINLENYTQEVSTNLNSTAKLNTLTSELAFLPTDILMLDEYYREKVELSETLILPVSNNTDKFEKAISAYASFDNNLIYTPADEQYKIFDAVIFDSPGFSVGATYDLKLNETMEIGTGLGYTNVSYSPQVILEKFIPSDLGGTYQVYLDRIRFDMVHVPLNMKLNVLKNDKWALFTQIGLTANIITHSNYETVALQIEAPRDRNNLVEKFQDPYSSYGEGEGKPKLFNKPFTKGFIQGGAFKNNIHVTANMGIGVSRNINDQVSLFSLVNLKSPTLNFTFGPNQDKLGSLSMTLGAQLRI